MFIVIILSKVKTLRFKQQDYQYIQRIILKYLGLYIVTMLVNILAIRIQVLKVLSNLMAILWIFLPVKLR